MRMSISTSCLVLVESSIIPLDCARGDEPVARGDEPVARGDEPVARGDEPVARGDEPVAPRGDGLIKHLPLRS